MGKTVPMNFGINSYKSKSGLASAERLVNCYAEPAPEDSPFKAILLGTDGLSVWKDLGIGFPVYGMEVMDNNLYVVAGSNVYKVDETKTVTTLGTISSAPSRVIMTNNGTQVSILTESGTLWYATTSTLTQVTDSDYTLSDSIATLDGYTIATNQEDRIFQWSSINDTSAWAALDFQSVEADASDIVRAIMNNLELWFFKKDIIQVYYNSGRPGFVFDRKEGVFIQKGCAAKNTVASLDGAFYFLGNDRIIYTTGGYQLAPISTFPISQEIEKYSTVSDAFGFTYISNGHKFYCITFPTADTTWEYNITTGLWHERQSINSSQRNGRWRATCNAFFAGVNLFGDFETGIIYQSNPDAYTENGTAILRKIVSATQFANYSRATVDRFTLMMDTGVGIAEGQGSSPKIMLRTSFDGAKTFGSIINQPLGEIGTYEKEVAWTGVGYGRSAIFEITYSEPTKFAIVGAFLNTTIGNS
tara:strand:+ start:2489 stop:3907 length:1419 start_codon:yes stop_codon:yes gene_type:complete